MLVASAMFAIMGRSEARHRARRVAAGGAVPRPSVILLLIWARAGRQSIVPTSWKLHLWRNLSGVTSMWLGFYAIAHLPLATATSLNYTGPPAAGHRHQP